jgi:hemerythrin-like domain-containing protein
MSRRGLFAAGGVGGVGLVLNIASAAAPAEAASKSASPDPPDVDLMQEHGVLKRVLLIYQECIRRQGIGQELPMSAVHDSAEIIHDFIEGFHEALEEGYVFPRLRSARMLVGTVDTLLLQHARGRQRTQLILAASGGQAAVTSSPAQIIGAMTAFVRMYQPHEAREDTVIFPAFRSILTHEQIGHLGAVFADLQRQQFGRNGFSETVSKVATIEQGLGIYDLSQFTPEPVTT